MKKNLIGIVIAIFTGTIVGVFFGMISWHYAFSEYNRKNFIICSLILSFLNACIVVGIVFLTSKRDTTKTKDR